MVSSSITWFAGVRTKFGFEKLRGVHLRPDRGKDRRKVFNTSSAGAGEYREKSRWCWEEGVVNVGDKQVRGLIYL